MKALAFVAGGCVVGVIAGMRESMKGENETVMSNLPPYAILGAVSGLIMGALDCRRESVEKKPQARRIRRDYPAHFRSSGADVMGPLIARVEHQEHKYLTDTEEEKKMSRSIHS